MNLYQISTDIIDLLATVEGRGGEITPDEEERLEQLLGAEGNKVDGYLAVRSELYMMEEAAKKEASRLTAVAKTRKNQRLRLESRLRDHMDRHNTRRLEGNLGKVWIQSAGGGSVAFEGDQDETLQWLRDHGREDLIRHIPEEYVVDRAKIKEALKAGEEVDTVSLTPPVEGLRFR